MLKLLGLKCSKTLRMYKWYDWCVIDSFVAWRGHCNGQEVWPRAAAGVRGDGYRHRPGRGPPDWDLSAQHPHPGPERQQSQVWEHQIWMWERNRNTCSRFNLTSNTWSNATTKIVIIYIFKTHSSNEAIKKPWESYSRARGLFVFCPSADFLREDTMIGNSFLRVAAHDDDFGTNAAITYSMSNEEPEYLRVNPLTGWVYVNQPISQVHAAFLRFLKIKAYIGSRFGLLKMESKESNTFPYQVVTYWWLVKVSSTSKIDVVGVPNSFFWRTGPRPTKRPDPWFNWNVQRVGDIQIVKKWDLSDLGKENVLCKEMRPGLGYK